VTDRKDLIRKNSYFQFIFPNCLKNRVFYPLDLAVKKNNIDLLWFLSPDDQFVRVPYVIPVWDLESRLQPYFPEFINYFETGRDWIRASEKSHMLFNRALYVIAGTQYLKDQLHLLYNVPEQRIKVLPFPVPSFVIDADIPLSIPESLKEATTSPFLFYPAQFWAHKNHVSLLLAMKILKQRDHININLVLTGSDMGNLNFIKKKVVESGLADSVFFPGFVKNEDILYLYRNAIALVFPTFFGPDNLPPLEAFSLGCPVIASRLPGTGEQLGDAAICVDPSDEVGFAEAVKSLMTNTELRNSLVLKGKIIAKKWSSSDYVKGILDIADDFEKIQRNWQSGS